jgi:uncharacterized protein (TIGR03067 family)
MLRLILPILLAGALAADAPKTNGKTDQLEGTWVATSYVDQGKKLDDVAELKMTLILKGGKYSLKIKGDVVDQGTYSSDASKTPKHLNTTASEGPMKGKVDPGIYELKGEVLKTAFNEVDKQSRPTGFDGEKYQVVDFRRAKE